jgi:hypothetical protein
MADDYRNINRNDTLSSIDSSLPQIQSAEKLAPTDVQTAKYTSSTDLKNRVDKTSIDDEDWESDPENPRNWSSGKKWTAVAIVSGRREI